MADTWPYRYAYWPHQLPLPTPLQRNKGWVPNRLSVDLPWAQFAPSYLPPGSGSTQPFTYPANGTARAPLRRLQFTEPSFTTSGVGPAGDLAQLPPPYGEPNMAYRVRFNQGEPEAATAAVDQLLTTPAEVPVDVVVAEQAAVEATLPPAEAAPVEASPAETIEAATVVSEAPFTPFEPDLLVGLKPALLTKLQNLESTLTKLSTATRGPALESTYQRLLRLHDRIERMLERRLVRRERFKGRGPRAQKLIAKYHQKKVAVLTQRYQAKVENIQQVREAYQSGQISGDRARELMTAIVRPGVQMPGLAAEHHPIAAAHPIGAQAVVAAATPRYTLFKR